MSRSTTIFQAAQQGQEKFDYFLTALTGAIFSYVMQTYVPRKLGMNAESLIPLGLILLGVSLYLGFKRIETAIATNKLNHQMLDAAEKAGEAAKALSAGFVEGVNAQSGDYTDASTLVARRQEMLAKRDVMHGFMQERMAIGLRYYQWRNRTLLAALAVLALGKILTPYEASLTPLPIRSNIR